MPSWWSRTGLVALALIVGLNLTGASAETTAPSPPPSQDESSHEPAVETGPVAAFVRVTTLTLHPRTFYFDGTPSTGAEHEARAGRGWLRHRCGWLLDSFALGAALPGPAP